MAWSYSETNLTTETASGKLNTARLLVGDTDSSDPLVQDEEITFAVSQANGNVYYAAAWICRVIAAKFSRMVTTQLDGALSANYSDRAKQYQLLATQVEAQGKKTSGKSLGVFGGGISEVNVQLANQDSDRVKPAFTINQFDNVEAGTQFIPEEPNGI